MARLSQGKVFEATDELERNILSPSRASEKLKAHREIIGFANQVNGHDHSAGRDQKGENTLPTAQARDSVALRA